MFKLIRVSFLHNSFGNSKVVEKSSEVKEGVGWKTMGIEITPDHRYIFLEPFKSHYGQTIMKCDTIFQMTPLRKIVNFLTRQPSSRHPRKDIKTRTRFKLEDIYSVTFYDGYDDSTYSFDDANNLDQKEKKVE